jgi:hypothetical protein
MRWSHLIGYFCGLTISNALAVAASADESPNYFGFFPDGPQLELARGFIQNDLSKPFGEICLDFTKGPATSGSGAQSISLRTEVVTSYSSMLSVFGSTQICLSIS